MIQYLKKRESFFPHASSFNFYHFTGEWRNKKNKILESETEKTHIPG
jgi:hypothetical protein